MMAHWLERLRSFDLRELNLESLGSWSSRRQALMALAWVVVLSGVGYALLLQVSVAQLQQQREAETALKTEFESRALQVASLDAHVMQVHELQAAFSTLLKRLPNQAEVPGLLDEISRLGLTAGLVIERIQWAPEVPQPFYTELPLQMTLAGRYHDLGLFVSGLANLPRIVTVHDFALAPVNPAGDGQLRMTLLAKTYRSHDQGLIP